MPMSNDGVCNWNWNFTILVNQSYLNHDVYFIGILGIRNIYKIQFKKKTEIIRQFHFLVQIKNNIISEPHW